MTRSAPPKTSDVDCAERLKVLSDPTRLAVIEMLMKGPRRVGDLHAALDVDQSLLSHHLAVLRDAGFVEAQRAGKGVLYRLAPDVELPPQAGAIDLGCCQISFGAAGGAGPSKPRARGGGRSAIGLAIAAAGLSVLAGCGGGDAAARSKLSITGSSTVAPLVAEIAKRFESLHPEVRIDVQSGGSSRGVADARSGVADLGMASRTLKADEGDLVPHTIALDGIAMIVHAKNGVKELAPEQIVAIYKGEVRDWSGAGGAPGPITVVNKAEGRSTLELFLGHFQLKVDEVRADVVIGDNAQGIKTVAANESAIGYVSIGSAACEIDHGTPIRMLPLGGVAASLASVRDATFPICRPLNLVSKGEPTGLVKQFVDFACSDAVTDLVEAQFFVPLDRRAATGR